MRAPYYDGDRRPKARISDCESEDGGFKSPRSPQPERYVVRYVEAHCKKCGGTFKLDLGELSVEEARANLEAQETFECPGHHVELSGPSNYWTIDWNDVKEDNTEPMTDEEWRAQYRDKFEHVVDTQGLRAVVDKIVGFSAGSCRVIRDGTEELVDFAHAPSGKRYYFVGTKKTAASAQS